MNISPQGLELIERFEGYRDEQYRDAIGVPTIGYGTTASVIRPLPETCTQAEASRWLADYVDRDCIPAIEALDVELNQHMIDALCSFVYNLGPGVLAPSSTMGHLLRCRDYRTAALAFMLYDHAAGVVLPGLRDRRAAEQALFNEPVPTEVAHNNREEILAERERQERAEDLHDLKAMNARELPNRREIRGLVGRLEHLLR